MREDRDYWNHTPIEEINYEDENDSLWNEKIEEIRKFPSEKSDKQITNHQVEELIKIYNQYQHVFSDTPGKVKNFQCKIKFKEPVEFK